MESAARLIVAAVIVSGFYGNVHAFRYNYLNSEYVLNFTLNLLVDEGIPMGDIRAWKDKVERYNERIEMYDRSGSGWRASNNAEDFSEESRVENGVVNCRMSLFILVRSLIMVTNEIVPEATSDNIKSEIERMNGLLPEPMTAVEEAAYESLFDPLRFEPRTLEPGVASDVLKQYLARWREAGLQFPSNCNLKIVQAIVIEPESGIAFCDHAGLMIMSGERVYFIEKISFLSPFVVTAFDSEPEFVDYFYSTYENLKNKGVIILVNNNAVRNNLL